MTAAFYAFIDALPSTHSQLHSTHLSYVCVFTLTHTLIVSNSQHWRQTHM